VNYVGYFTVSRCYIGEKGLFTTTEKLQYRSKPACHTAGQENSIAQK